MFSKSNPPLVTVFGGGGFVGRYVCEALLKMGARLRVAERDPRKAWFLQPLGGVGMVAAVAADFNQPATVDAAVKGADAVINLVGLFKGDLDTVHIATPARIAELTKSSGAAFVHISAIGADPESKSDYGRTKGLGEGTVRSAYGRATVIRPSTVFGAEDQFTNRFAAMAGFPIVPVIAPNTRFQPVYVRDLARAIAAAALDPVAHGAKIYELGGPDVMTMRRVNEEVARMSGQSPLFVNVPDFAAAIIAALGFLPGAPLSRDQWIMLQQDNVVARDVAGFASFGISPSPMDAVAPEWLERYLPGGRFAPRPAA